MQGAGSRLSLQWAARSLELVPLCTTLYPFVFPHFFPIILALIKRQAAHFLKFVRGEGLREMGECGLHRSSLPNEFHFHHLKGEEGISCISFSLIKLLEYVRVLTDCRIKDPFGIHT